MLFVLPTLIHEEPEYLIKKIIFFIFFLYFYIFKGNISNKNGFHFKEAVYFIFSYILHATNYALFQ